MLKPLIIMSVILVGLSMLYLALWQDAKIYVIGFLLSLLTLYIITSKPKDEEDIKEEEQIE